MGAIYAEMAAAMHADDVDRYVQLLDEDFAYVRHKSGDALNLVQMAALLKSVWRPGNRRIDALRCVYENDDILVVHTCLHFRSGSRESALIAHVKRPGTGKILRIESGVSELSG